MTVPAPVTAPVPVEFKGALKTEFAPDTRRIIAQPHSHSITGTQVVAVAGYNANRRRIMLMVVGQSTDIVIVASSQADAASGTGAELIGGVPVYLEHHDPIFVAGSKSTTSVDISAVEEIYAR